MSGPPRLAGPTAIRRGEGGVVAVLPVQRFCPGTVHTAVAYARAAGVPLIFAMIMPWPDPLHGYAVTLPYKELWFDYELQLSNDLTPLLEDTGVGWSLYPVFQPARELPALVDATGAAVVMVHQCSRQGRFSLARRRTRRLATALADRTEASVQLVCTPWDESVDRRRGRVRSETTVFPRKKED